MSKRTVIDFDGNNLSIVEYFIVRKHQHKLSMPWGNIRRRMWMAKHRIVPGKPVLDPGKTYAPWTDEQVALLNQWQSGLIITDLPNNGARVTPTHPYTCCGHDGCKRSERPDEGILIVNKMGLTCPCGKYKQYWYSI